MTAARWYTAGAGGFLLVQGVLTLTFRLVPALDAAFPLLLATTRMVPPHSALHIATGLVALAVLRWGGERGPAHFAAGFGAGYTVLALSGLLTGGTHGLGLQPFDHPFHLVLGLLGMGAAVLALLRSPDRAGAR